MFLVLEHGFHFVVSSLNPRALREAQWKIHPEARKEENTLSAVLISIYCPCSQQTVGILQALRGGPSLPPGSV